MYTLRLWYLNENSDLKNIPKINANEYHKLYFFKGTWLSVIFVTKMQINNFRARI